MICGPAAEPAEARCEILCMDPTKLPVWLRVTLVTGIVVLVAGSGLFAWRWYAKPTTLTIAAGLLDGEAWRR